jgi:hypothetical protein
VATERARRAAERAAEGLHGQAQPRRGRGEGAALRGKIIMVTAALALCVLRRGALGTAAAAAAGREAGRALRSVHSAASGSAHR